MKDGPPHAVGGGTRRTVHRSTQTVPRSHDQRSWLRDRECPRSRRRMVDAQVEVGLVRHPLARLWLRRTSSHEHAMDHGTLARVAAIVPPKPPLIARANPSHTGPRANDKTSTARPRANDQHRRLDLGANDKHRRLKRLDKAPAAQRDRNQQQKKDTRQQRGRHSVRRDGSQQRKRH